MMRLTFLVAASAAARQSDSILLPPVAGKTGPSKLLLLVPVGPPEVYQPMAESIQHHSNLRLSVGIAVCSSHVPIFNMTLCDPEFELTPVLKTLIEQANAIGALEAGDIFVGGNSVGGACARRFVDTQYDGAAGVLFFGTQYRGDTENLMTGLLGYPTDFSKYTTPFLAMTGELDKFSVDNLAMTVQQWQSLTGAARFKQYPVIVSGMDASAYSFPYTMKDDLLPEISQSAALDSIGEITGAWLDFVAGESSETERLDKWSEATVAITAPFLEAMELDKSWCENMQQRLPGLPDGTEIEVLKVSMAKLDSCHTKYEVKADGGLKLTLCDYTNYVYRNQPPWMPQYAGAEQISCKFIGEDRIAQLMNMPLPDMKSTSVQNRCRELNGYAVDAATDLVQKHWPTANARFADQGKRLTLADDKQTSAGPLWLLAGLSVTETSDEIVVQTPALATTIKSMIYPGNHYCKLLSPSKVVDIIMTMGLTKRYGAEATSIIV